ELAHQRFGRMPWRELLAPAVALARQGMLLDWYAGLMIASNARALSLDRDAAALFLEDGRWPPLISWTAVTEKRLDQRKLAATLGEIASSGSSTLYGGDIGKALVKDVREKGGCLSVEDLASYRAHMVDALEVPYRGGRVFAAPGMTGGPTLAFALKVLSETGKPNYIDYARALDAAWRGRFQTMGD